MACTGNHFIVFDTLKGRKIDTDKITVLPTNTSEIMSGTWYRAYTYLYYMKDTILNDMAIYHNDTVNNCLQNPIVDCDNCLRVGGTWTVDELTSAVNKLPFVQSSNVGIYIIGGTIIVGLGILYFATRAKK